MFQHNLFKGIAQITSARVVVRALLVLMVAVGMTATSADAQQKAGRTGAGFLKVGVGARATALGSAASSITGDATQFFWNPAGTALTADAQMDVSLSYNKWIADLDHYSAAIAYNMNDIGTLTLGITSFGISGIPANRQNGYADPILAGLETDEATSETYDAMDFMVGLSFSRYITDRLSLGATAKVINESIDDQSASAVGFDFGSIYHIGVAGWVISSRISNIGSDITFYNQANPLPLSYSIGTSFYPINTEQARLMLSVDATKPQDSQQLLFGGAEIALYDLLFIRGGMKFNYAMSDDGGTSEREAINTTVEKFSVGAGIQYQVSGYNLAVDYAYTGVDLFDNVHQVTLRFGK